MGKLLQFRRTKEEADDIVTQDKDSHYAILNLTAIQATRPDAVLVEVLLNVQNGVVLFNFMKKDDRSSSVDQVKPEPPDDPLTPPTPIR